MKKNNLKITFSLIFVVSFMLFLSFAAVPLYKLFCQVTGYGGTPKIASLENKTNISEKNKYYGEYTYHYWIWKNYLDKLDDGWIGFCQYRKFWSLKKYKTEDINFNSLNSQVLKEIPNKFDEYESILGEPIFINQFRATKFIKKGLKRS